MKSGTFEFNKGEIYFELVGEGETIVFLHGFSLDRRMWQPQVEYFSKTHQVLAYDMRGYGKSSLPSDYYSQTVDLKGLLNFLGIKNIHLVGLSLGGEIAIDFTIAYPEIVKTLTLMNTSLNGYENTVNWDVEAEKGIKKAKQNWLNHKVFEHSNKNPVVKKALEEIVSDYSGWHWVNKSLSKRVTSPAIEKLNEIKIPVSIIVGEKELAYYHDISKVIERSLENSVRVVVPNCGHMLNLENPEYINRLISSNIKID